MFHFKIVVNNGPVDGRLRYLGLPLLSQCPRPTTTSNMLCAGGYYGKGVCAGDSGGPLVVPRSESDDTAIVIGISSFTYGNCGQFGEDVFARVQARLGWIKDKMEK